MAKVIIDEVCLNPTDNGNGWDLWPDGQITDEDMAIVLRNTLDTSTSLVGIELRTGSLPWKVFYNGLLPANGTARFYNNIDSGIDLETYPLHIELWNKYTTPWTLLDEFVTIGNAPNACWQRQVNDTWVEKAGPRSAGF